MFKRICLASIAFVVIMICGLALTTPVRTNSYIIDSKGDSVVHKLGVEDITQSNNCSVESNGSVSITGADAHIIFSCADVASFGSVVLNIRPVYSENISIQVCFDTGSGFSEDNTVKTIYFKGDTAPVFPCAFDRIYNIKIDIDDPYIFQSLQFHSADAVLQPNKLKISSIVCIINAFIALIIAAFFFVLDIKFDFSGKLLSAFKKARFTILKGAISFLLCGFISAIFEYIFGHYIFGRSSNGAVFNMYRFFLIFGILFSIAYLILCRKIATTKFENVFLGASLILCTTMVLVCPFGHISWDTDTHYKWALNASYLGDSYITQADNNVITNHIAAWPSQSATENAERIAQMNQAYKTYLSKNPGETTIAHRMCGLFMAVARLFGGSFYQVLTFAKMGNVLIYCYVCYFAIKKLKSGKAIATVIALIPTSLFLAANFSYDYWVNCFVLLGMAYFVGEHQEKDKPISIKNTVVMCSAFALAAMPKLVYALFLIIPFFMRREKIHRPKVYYSICTLATVTLLAMLAFKTISQMRGGGDMRGGSDVSTFGQIQFFLEEPFRFTGIIIKFLTNYLSISGIVGYVSNYAYLGMGTGASVWIILMFITALTDKNDYDVNAYNWLSKCLVVLIYFGVAAAIVLALYLEFTPVRLETVNGCQPRYIIPLLYPLLSIIGWGRFKNSIPQNVYNYSVLSVCCAVNFYNIATVILPYWL